MSELWQKGAVELAALIRDREVSSREVIQAHLDRIEAVNPHLNAIVRLLADQALAAADAADRAVADGASLGPLHGVPCTVKENIDLAGTPTTQAVPALAEAVAPVDAPQVERLRASPGQATGLPGRPPRSGPSASGRRRFPGGRRTPARPVRRSRRHRTRRGRRQWPAGSG
jgi:amidase